MTAVELLARLHMQGVDVRTDGAVIRLRPRAAVTPEDVAAVTAAKPELLRLLASGAAHTHPDTPLQIDLPTPTARPRHVAEAVPFLPMPLDQFMTDGAPLEVSVPWLDVTLWFVPTERDAEVLLKEGVARGRIWTARELMEVMARPDMTPEALQAITYAKLELEGDVIETRPRVDQSPLPTSRRRDPESAGVPEPRGETSSPRQRQDRIAGPWPDALPGLGSRTIVAYSPCTICGSGSWARYGETVLCLDCARGPRSLRLLRFRTALGESWRLMAKSSDADPAECQRCMLEIFRLEAEIGEPLATTLRRAWEDQWWTETKTCPTCGGAVRHSSETGEETDP